MLGDSKHAEMRFRLASGNLGRSKGSERDWAVPGAWLRAKNQGCLREPYFPPRVGNCWRRCGVAWRGLPAAPQRGRVYNRMREAVGTGDDSGFIGVRELATCCAHTYFFWRCLSRCCCAAAVSRAGGLNAYWLIEKGKVYVQSDAFMYFDFAACRVLMLSDHVFGLFIPIYGLC